MLYSVEHDLHYLMHDISAIESLNKLGEQHGTFAFNSLPKRYLEVWTPLQIDFHKLPESKNTPQLPDVSVRYGRLYLSTSAYSHLREQLQDYGEFLPVTHQGANGFIFNPLITAESLAAVDESQVIRDAQGNVIHYELIAAKIGQTALFKTRIDGYTGLYCNETFKALIEQLGLKGVKFNPDLAIPSESSAAVMQ